VVTASGDRTARLWDGETGKEIARLEGHQSVVASAAFSPDGKRVVTASWDKTARLWDGETGKEIARLEGHQGNVTSAAFSPDGKRVVTASEDTTARTWRVYEKTQDLVIHAKSLMKRCLTRQQRKRIFLPAEPPAWCIERRLWPFDPATSIARTNEQIGKGEKATTETGDVKPPAEAPPSDVAAQPAPEPAPRPPQTESAPSHPDAPAADTVVAKPTTSVAPAEAPPISAAPANTPAQTPGTAADGQPAHAAGTAAAPAPALAQQPTTPPPAKARRKRRAVEQGIPSPFQWP
jgi:dipeptidyl aminopeptidase/acylaminoacyl peptidase